MQALQRSKYAIAWERSWPHLARLLTVIGLFLVVSWAGLWLAPPFFPPAIRLFLFFAPPLGLFLVCGRGVGRVFPPTKFPLAEPERGLDRVGPRLGIRHRPATA